MSETELSESETATTDGTDRPSADSSPFTTPPLEEIGRSGEPAREAGDAADEHED